MSEATPTPTPSLPEPMQAQHLNFWDAQIRTAQEMVREVAYEYTSKNRLRRIAMLALGQAIALMMSAKQNEEADAEAQQQPEPEPESRQSRLILPNTQLVVPK